MLLLKIDLRNFRNIQSTSLEFSKGMNILYGKNGSGKTNLAEAVYYFAIAKSFRVQREEKVVKSGEYASASDLYYVLDPDRNSTPLIDGEETLCGLRMVNVLRSHISIQQAGIKYIEHEGFNIKPSELVGKFRAVLYTPDTPQTVIKGPPAEKRRFLDIALCQADATYLQSLNQYNRIAKERVSVMKQRLDWAWKNYGGPHNIPKYGSDVEKFDFLIRMYTEMMSSPAGYIMFMRRKFTGLLEKHMNEFLDYVYDGRIRTGVIYRPSIIDNCNLNDPLCSYNGFLTRSLRSCYDYDNENAVNSYGVSKDSLIFEFNGKEAKDVASQGQMRIIGIALKFAEGLASKGIGTEMPVYILDDVMSELDRKTQMRITDIFSSYQTIITTADSGYLDEASSFYAVRSDKPSFLKVFTVSDGTVAEL